MMFFISVVVTVTADPGWSCGLLHNLMHVVCHTWCRRTDMAKEKASRAHECVQTLDGCHVTGVSPLTLEPL